ncbi:MAG: alpha-ketoglutarate-dependent dioxygenase AlkB [Pseudomonadota bacterium]
MADFLFIEQFISNPDPLFHQLLEETIWDKRMKARKTASFGIAYNYSQITYDDAPFPDSLKALCGTVCEAVGFEPNNCLLNYYPDGASSMGFHSDTATGRSAGTGVAIVSLGAAREMRFRHKLDKDNTSARMLTAGSLIYLDDATQEHWLHAIPKAEGSGPRISLSFRSIETAA